MLKAQPLSDCTQLSPEQRAGCERFELSSDNIVPSLQSEYTREIVDRLSVAQRQGSRLVTLRLRQQDQMAAIQIARTYVTVTYPGATPEIPPATVKNPRRSFNAAMSPDIVNRYSVTARVGYMTRKKACAELGQTVRLPSFENYAAVALDQSMIKPGDKVGSYAIKDDTSTFVTPHTSVARLTQRKPLTRSRLRLGSCVVVHQTSTSRKPGVYGNRSERDTFVWGPFRRADSARAYPRSAKLKRSAP